jgi:hypothetical protein
MGFLHSGQLPLPAQLQNPVIVLKDRYVLFILNGARFQL